TVDCPFEGAKHLGALYIRSCLLQSLLSAAAGLLCASFINLLGVLRCNGQHCHNIIAHLEETAGYKQRLLGTTELNAHLADGQSCKQCSVTWQDAEHTLCSLGNYHIGLAAIDLAFGGHHLNMQCIACRHRLAL